MNNFLDAFDLALQKIETSFKVENLKNWHCERCDTVMPVSKLLRVEDPEYAGKHLYFCCNHCRKAWFDRFEYFNS